LRVWRVALVSDARCLGGAGKAGQVEGGCAVRLELEQQIRLAIFAHLTNPQGAQKSDSASNK
jgi:hypothetical protein